MVTSENGQDTFEIVAAAPQDDLPFETIVMDMQMPVMIGYAAARRLRTMSFERPIIASTTHLMDGDCDKCIDAG